MQFKRNQIPVVPATGFVIYSDRHVFPVTGKLVCTNQSQRGVVGGSQLQLPGARSYGQNGARLCAINRQKTAFQVLDFAFVVGGGRRCRSRTRFSITGSLGVT